MADKAVYRSSVEIVRFDPGDFGTGVTMQNTGANRPGYMVTESQIIMFGTIDVAAGTPAATGAEALIIASALPEEHLPDMETYPGSGEPWIMVMGYDNVTFGIPLTSIYAQRQTATTSDFRLYPTGPPNKLSIDLGSFRYRHRGAA